MGWGVGGGAGGWVGGGGGVLYIESLLRTRPVHLISISITVGQRKKVTAVTFFSTEEGNCSYLLPRAPATDQRGIHTDQIRKVPVYEITWFFEYRMGETRSQLGANNGILTCLGREIWQFKLFARKEVTAVPATRGEGGHWRRGRRLLYLCWNWIALSF